MFFSRFGMSLFGEHEHQFVPGWFNHEQVRHHRNKSSTELHLPIWGFPKIGVPQIIYIFMGLSNINPPAIGAIFSHCFALKLDFVFWAIPAPFFCDASRFYALGPGFHVTSLLVVGWLITAWVQKVQTHRSPKN